MITQGFTMKWLTENQGLVLFFLLFFSFEIEGYRNSFGEDKRL